MSESQSSFQTQRKNLESTSFDDETNQESCSELLDALEKIKSKIARGPAPAFTEAHVIKTVEIIANYKIVGRTILSNKLELGIGTTRTILKHLKNYGYIASSKFGFELSPKGKKLFSQIQSKISQRIQVPKNQLAVGPVVVAVLVKNAGHKVNKGIEQRNTAIRAGAAGATTLVYCDNKIVMPLKKKHSTKGLKQIQQTATSKLNPQNNDVVILGSGTTPTNAEIGAIMAAIKLLKNNNINK
ncbi:MAG: DUF4443 domain-containing protein [Candidatus Bathyarchaeota archaeon]|nr:DUF4443 domain-containing protein [Candidatus Bathyarchaeum tardum]WGM88863.1 MAG: DUF4443 domain-containing protein [Candidatus Bathyarchaeum tardum]